MGSVGAVAGLVEAGQRAVGVPVAKVLIHGRPGWKTGGPAPPLTTRMADITHSVKYLSQKVAAFAVNR
jgi:hypothetical protein